ncbi:MAG: TraB/GumN family protein [Novosphingobium sp.]|nr:TraB/GumN family protein [Novosphingobium sp.]MCP5401356.1 TraB/GumN family protein [Novosphingobium sp.]
MDRISRWIALIAAALAANLTASLAVPALAGEKAPEVPAEEVAPAEEAATEPDEAPDEDAAAGEEPAADGDIAPPGETAAAAKAVPAQKPVRPALWKIADEDTTIYLFGTIHALPSRIDWLQGKVADAFEESGELITEIVREDPAQMQMLVFGKAMLPQGETLRGMLSPEEKAEYESALAAYGLPAQAFDRFEPWYTAVALSTVPMMRDGFASENGVEDTLQSRSATLGQSHGALETAEYQLDLFDTLPLDVQKRYLAQVVEDLPTMKDDLRKMVDAWKHGDAEELARLMNAQEDDPALVEALLTGRNRKWAEWIGNRLEEPGTVFLAVGAGHLAGEGSVQDQLSANGIAAERLQ